VIGLPFVEGYGLSETMAPSHINPPQRPKRQCAGIPFFNTDARVIDPESLRELPPNEVGEIIVHGPQVFRGYWNQPQATAEAFLLHDGKRFFRTGDLGYYDEEGYFFITDRLKRMLNCAGFKVWPAEVEAMLYAHPAIQEACVIGARDPYRGETVKALVVPKKEYQGKVDPQAIIDWARGKMAAFKVPRIVEFVDELPRTHTGKIQRFRLRQGLTGTPSGETGGVQLHEPEGWARPSGYANAVSATPRYWKLGRVRAAQARIRPVAKIHWPPSRSARSQRYIPSVTRNVVNTSVSVRAAKYGSGG
jgi:acyl-CoA synthetase (AMP-forming)/AMP-acid ligase II